MLDWNLDSGPHACYTGFLSLQLLCQPFVCIFDSDFQHAVHFILRPGLLWLDMYNRLTLNLGCLNLLSKCRVEKDVKWYLQKCSDFIYFPLQFAYCPRHRREEKPFFQVEPGFFLISYFKVFAILATIVWYLFYQESIFSLHWSPVKTSLFSTEIYLLISLLL
jgi:hypothetical protein